MPGVVHKMRLAMMVHGGRPVPATPAASVSADAWRGRARGYRRGDAQQRPHAEGRRRAVAPTNMALWPGLYRPATGAFVVAGAVGPEPRRSQKTVTDGAWRNFRSLDVLVATAIEAEEGRHVRGASIGEERRGCAGEANPRFARRAGGAITGHYADQFSVLVDDEQSQPQRTKLTKLARPLCAGWRAAPGPSRDVGLRSKVGRKSGAYSASCSDGGPHRFAPIVGNGAGFVRQFSIRGFEP